MNRPEPSSLQPLTDPSTAGVALWMDKRKSKRVRYCAAIPVNNAVTRVPDQATFEAVEARDLSQSGFSFYCSTAPEEPWIVVQLGDDREALFVSARVVRCEKDYQDPARRFIIGCEFVRQLAGSPD